MGVLILTEQRACDLACGVVHSQQQHELRSIVSKPPVVAAIYLYQHPLAWHPLPTNTVFRWTTAARAVHSGFNQYPSQSAASYLYTLAFSQQFAQMGVVGS